MPASGLGKQTRPFLRAVVFMTFMTFMILLYYNYYDFQYYNFVDGLSNTLVVKNYNDSDIVEDYVKHGYIVWSPSCRIPNISAYHESIRSFVSKWKPLTCSHEKVITKLIYNATSHTYTITLDEPVLQKYSLKSHLVQCCYSVISRETQRQRRNNHDDDRTSISKPICYGQETILPPLAEYVYVECKSKNRAKFSYKHLHSMIVEKKKIPPRKVNETSKHPDKFSVLLFGIDSISRLNLMRTMPLTFKYLNSKPKEWIDLEGYTKMGDNTFPNLIALLTGLTVNQLGKKCWKSHSSKLDDCPFIWKEFANQSYITAYLEDQPKISTFNFEKYGFLNSPTDYYSRPYLMAGKKFLKTKFDGGMEYCLGIQEEVEYLFHFTEEFVKRFHDRPYFHLLWTNTFSHNELNMPTVMDARVKKFLENMDDYLNSTIVIFFSDHGMRFGKIRETFVGWLEERMPFIYFRFPQSFKSKYPEKFANILANKNRLTSPYDLHATLQDILYGKVLRSPEGCPTCDTLFKKAVWNRSCENAGISEHWCTCSSDFQSLSTKEPVIVSAANFAISQINQYLTSSKNGTQTGTYCATLHLGNILSVRSKIKGLSMFKTHTYIIVFETKPSGAIFEVTVQLKSVFEIPNSVSRINAYGSQGSCVKSDANLKKYCFCVKK